MNSIVLDIKNKFMIVVRNNTYINFTFVPKKNNSMFCSYPVHVYSSKIYERCISELRVHLLICQECALFRVLLNVTLEAICTAIAQVM